MQRIKPINRSYSGLKDLNERYLACKIETLLSEMNILCYNYVHFYAVRIHVHRASGGISFLVKKDLLTRELEIKVS